MRHFLTWLLLLVVSFHWIGGHVYYKMSILTEEKWEMDEVAQAIAASLEHETGIEADIDILENFDIENMEGIGYSGFFVYSKKVDNQDINYTLKKSKHLKTQEILVKGNQQPSGSDDLLLAQLFPQLYYQDISISLPHFENYNHQDSFGQQRLITLFNSFPTTPPPNA